LAGKQIIFHSLYSLVEKRTPNYESLPVIRMTVVIKWSDCGQRNFSCGLLIETLG
jgi:hypothetical protein